MQVDEHQSLDQELRLDQRKASEMAQNLIDPFAAVRAEGATESLSAFFFGCTQPAKEAGSAGLDLFAIAEKTVTEVSGRTPP